MNRRIAAAVGTLVMIVTLIGGIFVIDDRYYKTAMAAEYRTRADLDRESGDVESRIGILECQMQLNDNPRKTRLLERQMEQLLDRQNRLIELQQGQ